MRFLIILLWLLLGFFYWKCKNACCDVPAAPAVIEEAQTISSIVPIKKLTPIKFQCSDDKAETEPEWIAFRDSLINNLSDDDILEIKGLNFKNENNSTSNDLGMRRAQNVLRLLGDGLDKSRMRVNAGTKGDSCMTEEMNNLIAFRYARNTAKVKEVDDKTLIYFPYGSNKKLDDEEVEAYLDDVAERVIASGERVMIIGHTDDDGSEGFNMRLGSRRALAIEDYLIRKGVNLTKVITKSKGEKEPIADNSTEEGRAKNRRTELKIIK